MDAISRTLNAALLQLHAVQAPTVGRQILQEAPEVALFIRTRLKIILLAWSVFFA